MDLFSWLYIELKNKTDFVIVLYHGGKEHYRYPSPYLQKVCRKCVDKGAGLVVCQHTHCIGCEEKYQNGTIVYGQGNFLFDHSESELWQTSMLVVVNDDMTISYLPIVKKGNTVRLAEGNTASEILTQFYKRSNEILTNEFIDIQYKKFAESMICSYPNSFSGNKNIIIRIINKLFKHKFMSYYFRRKYSDKNLLAIQNYVECEAHKELLFKGLICLKK